MRFVKLQDKDESVLELENVIPRIIRIGDNRKASMFLELYEKGRTHKVFFNYEDRDTMLKEKSRLLEVLYDYNSQNQVSG